MGGGGGDTPPPPPVIFVFPGDYATTSADDLAAIENTTTSTVEAVTGIDTVDRVETWDGSIRVVVYLLDTADDNANGIATLLATPITVTLPSGTTLVSIDSWRGGTGGGGGAGMGATDPTAASSSVSVASSASPPEITETNTLDSASNEATSGPDAGVIAGVAIGVLVFIAIVVGFIWSKGAPDAENVDALGLQENTAGGTAVPKIHNSVYKPRSVPAGRASWNTQTVDLGADTRLHHTDV